MQRTSWLAALIALAATPSFGDKAKNAGSALEMVKIPAGTFTMGFGERGGRSSPAHKVTLPAFEIDKYLVTTAAYQACVDAKECPATKQRSAKDKGCNLGQPGKDKQPINCVNYPAADSFCKWAGKRLPTEEEWEYAARGSDERTYPWGNDEPTETTRACWNHKKKKVTDPSPTCDVGSFPDGNSPFGVTDMAGNVDEWTSSPWTMDYDPNDKMAPGAATGHPTRGGGWNTGSPVYLTTWNRIPQYDGGDGQETQGFRCAR
jgi:formylglycine-generating enzyme required for sulfatase activity